jgi:hypothetical protein
MNSIIEDMKKIRTRTEIPLFLSTHGLNRRLFEIGVRFAYNAEQLLSCNPEILVLVDHYRDTSNMEQQDTNLKQDELDKIYTEAYRRFLPEKSVRLYRGTSKMASSAFPLMWFDYGYVDDDHSEKGSFESMCNWWPKVRQGGIMAGHDYIVKKAKAGTTFGVVAAVKRFMKEKKIPPECFHCTEYEHQSWFIYKIDGE